MSKADWAKDLAVCALPAGLFYSGNWEFGKVLNGYSTLPFTILG
jgi:hypothetical protein